MNDTPATEDRVLEALGRVQLFSQLDDRSRRKLAKLCTLKSFEPGDVLFKEGTMALSLLILTSGKVEVFKTSGDQNLGLGTVDTGGVLGQIALLDGQPRAATATALEPTECLLLTRDSFETLVKKDPQIAWCLTPALAERIRALQGAAVEAELAREESESAASGTGEEVQSDGKAADADDSGEDEDEDKDPSELQLALFKMMRVQYGLMAGTAKGMAEVARTMEGFLESMAEETDLKDRDDWRGLLDKVPDAMVSAARSALDEGAEVPEAMMDVYRRYSDAKE